MKIRIILFKLLSNGRYLHIPSATTEAEGSYQCVQSNKAGEGIKEFKIVVQGFDSFTFLSLASQSF